MNEKHWRILVISMIVGGITAGIQYYLLTKAGLK